MQGDPLSGTYGYASNDPVNLDDPTGLSPHHLTPMCPVPDPSDQGCVSAYGGANDLGYGFSSLDLIQIALNAGPTVPYVVGRSITGNFVGCLIKLIDFTYDLSAVGFGSDPGGGIRGAGNTSSNARPECDRKDPGNAQKLDWIKEHQGDAAKIAAQLGTTTANILGLSALESAWGKGPFVVNGGNNFFSQHYSKKKPAPFSTGPISGHNVPMAQYPNYAAAGASFAQIWGGKVQGVTDPTTFAANLQNAGAYGINPTTGAKVKSFVPSTVGTIQGIALRLDCPQ